MISGAVFRRGTCGNMGGHRRIPEHKADGFAGRTSRGSHLEMDVGRLFLFVSFLKNGIFSGAKFFRFR